MDLHHGQAHGLGGVKDGYGGVRVRAWVDHDAVVASVGILDGVDEVSLVV